MLLKNLSTILLVTVLLTNCTTNSNNSVLETSVASKENSDAKKHIKAQDPHYKVNWPDKKPFPQSVDSNSLKKISDHEKNEKTFHREMNRTKNTIDHNHRRKNPKYILSPEQPYISPDPFFDN